MMYVQIVSAFVVVLIAYVAIVRPWFLWWGATEEEIQRPMPGDDEIHDPTHVTTRAVTIDAPPSKVWPWLAQMGDKRGGMYSYDLVDRLLGVLDAPSSDEILPEFQSLKPGDVIPLGSGPDWPVKALEPDDWLLLDIEAPGMRSTWCWRLYDLGGPTRMVLRIRTKIYTRLMVTVFHLVDFGSFMMTRKHLLGIKERAEANVDP
jgi:hypothetical protein